LRVSDFGGVVSVAAKIMATVASRSTEPRQCSKD